MKPYFLSFLVGLFLLSGCADQRKERLYEVAQKFCEDLGMRYLGATTTGYDSEGDGYYSVEARCKPDGGGDEKLISLHCTIAYVWGSEGCKRRNILERNK